MKPINHEVVVTVSPELKDKIAQIMEHLEDYREAYLAGIGGFVLGYILRSTKAVKVVTEITPTIIIVPE